MRVLLWMLLLLLSATVAAAQPAALCPLDVAALSAECVGVARGEVCTTDGAFVRQAQGSLPAILPEHNLVFVAFGDVTLTNTITDSERITPGAPIPVTANTTARLRALPTTDSEIIGGVEAGTPLNADGLSPDSKWVRVAWGNASAWVSRSLVNGAAASLATLDPQHYGDWEGFTVTLASECAMLMMQTPRVTTLRVRVNGEPLEINNTVVFDSVEAGWLRVSALNGGVRLQDGVRIPRGFSAALRLDGDGNSTGEWRPPRPMNTPQLDRYRPLTELPVGVVNEAVTLPEGKFIRPGDGETTGITLDDLLSPDEIGD